MSKLVFSFGLFWSFLVFSSCNNSSSGDYTGTSYLNSSGEASDVAVSIYTFNKIFKFFEENQDSLSTISDLEGVTCTGNSCVFLNVSNIDDVICGGVDNESITYSGTINITEADNGTIVLDGFLTQDGFVDGTCVFDNLTFNGDDLDIDQELLADWVDEGKSFSGTVCGFTFDQVYEELSSYNDFEEYCETISNIE